MKSLYLTSVSLLKLPSLFKKPPGQISLAFIPSAANKYNDKWFVDKDRKALKEMGLSFFEVDIADQSFETLNEKIKNVDVIYVSGGNIFYLLDKVQRSGFDMIVKSHIKRGKLYAGGSAGAVLLFPTIAPFRYFDDPAQAPDLASTDGLGLVDFVILPHYGNKKYADLYEKAQKDCKKLGYKVKLLTDQEAIIVSGDDYQVIEVTK